MGEATGGLPPEVDAQDPLPEATWLWRRVFVFTLTTALCGGIGLVVDRIGSSQAANITSAYVSITRWMLLLLWFVVTYYLIAPSAEQVTRLIQTARVLKEGVTIRTRNIAMGPDGSAVSSTMEAGGGTSGTDTSQGAEEPSDGSELPGTSQDTSDQGQAR